MKEKILNKLTSRKLWVAIVAFVTLIMKYEGADAGTIESISSIIMAGATMIAYIIGEGLVDHASAGHEEGVNSDDSRDND